MRVDDNSHDNPAGRLLRIFERYIRHASADKSIEATWEETLGKSGPALSEELAYVVSLVPAIRLAVLRSGSVLHLGEVDRYAGAWVASIMTTSGDAVRIPSPGRMAINAEARYALASMSEYLHLTQSEGTVPSASDVEGIQRTLRDLIDKFRSAKDIPLELRREIIDRLVRLDWALHYLWIGGPEAVRFATERLLFLEHYTRTDKPTGERKKLATFLGRVYQLFTRGPEIEDALEGWGGIIDGVTKALE